ncbi:MAG: DUF99 family protein [Candidatus Thermoplasmatota archaeon]|nr:DUF99 family protein [Candidatus Thermoplasmatota archaeon]
MVGTSLKRETRVLGIDDGPYHRGSLETLIVMTLYRLDGYLDAVMTSRVTTDGMDSASRIAEILLGSRYLQQVRCIMSDGACLAGFNVLDIDELHQRTSVPVITVSDETPNTGSIMAALKANFDDWEGRLKLITRHSPRRLELDDGTCFVREKGITPKAADDIVKRCTVRGRVPEPVRLSHMIASAMDAVAEEVP